MSTNFGALGELLEYGSTALDLTINTFFYFRLVLLFLLLSVIPLIGVLTVYKRKKPAIQHCLP